MPTLASNHRPGRTTLLFAGVALLLSVGACRGLLGASFDRPDDDAGATRGTGGAAPVMRPVVPVKPAEPAAKPTVEPDAGPKAICVVGEVRCTGRNIESCRVPEAPKTPLDREWTWLVDCKSSELCVADPEKTFACASEPCYEGQLRCDGATLMRCSAAASEWSVHDDGRCDSPSRCATTEGGNCTENACAEGSVQCSGQELQVCRNKNWVTDTQCGVFDFCDVNAQDCVACTEGAKRCSGKSWVHCDSGRWKRDRVCQRFCDATAGCRETECEAGEFFCSATGALSECDAATGKFAEKMICESAESCDAALGECQPCDPTTGAYCARLPACPTKLALPGTGRCLQQGETKPETSLTQATCSEAGEQKFRFEPFEDELYRVVSEATGLCLATEDRESNTGSSLVLVKCAEETRQLITIKRLPSGTELRVGETGKCVGPADTSEASGMVVGVCKPDSRFELSFEDCAQPAK